MSSNICIYQKKVQKNLHFFTEVFQSLLLGRIYSVGLTILRRIADYFVQNRRFFLQESQIFCTFVADFALRMVAIATKFELNSML